MAPVSRASVAAGGGLLSASRRDRAAVALGPACGASSVPAIPGVGGTYKRGATAFSGMDTDAFLAEVREANETALSRLGSSKSLYAFTDGELEAAAVASVAANVSHAAAAALEAYAANASSDAAAEAFTAFGDLSAEHAGTAESISDDVPALESHDAVAALGEYGDGSGATDAERLGALVGYALVAKKIAEQSTGFFTGEADPQTASTFRSYGSDVEARRDDALDALAVVVDGDADREAALAAATAVVQGAYEEYTERLEAMGVNPKPVC
ncbi:rubrerythrin family protein [Halorubellus litoreus]|uniref:Rubrerythrin family protein n=1 Tax=Halorubellus litoreus TaxID=755308 RepID=A0ABD5VHW6_9EURY